MLIFGWICWSMLLIVFVIQLIGIIIVTTKALLYWKNGLSIKFKITIEWYWFIDIVIFIFLSILLFGNHII